MREVEISARFHFKEQPLRDSQDMAMMMDEDTHAFDKATSYLISLSLRPDL